MPERFKVTKTVVEADVDYAGSHDEEAALGHLLADKVDGEYYVSLMCGSAVRAICSLVVQTDES